MSRICIRFLPPSSPSSPAFSTLLMPIVFCVQFIFCVYFFYFFAGTDVSRGLLRARKSISYLLSTSKENPMRSVCILDGVRILDNNTDHYRARYHIGNRGNRKPPYLSLEKREVISEELFYIRYVDSEISIRALHVGTISSTGRNRSRVNKS